MENVKVVKCAFEGCSADVMAENGYCMFHGGKKQYLKDKRAGKFNKPAAAPAKPAEQKPAAPANPNGQTCTRYDKIRELQRRGGVNSGLGGLSKLDKERLHPPKNEVWDGDDEYETRM